MITVLMAVYQGKKYLEQQLDSILAQTVPVRIFVSDDGSDDGSREMLSQYQEWYPKQVFLMHRGAGMPRLMPSDALGLPQEGLQDGPQEGFQDETQEGPQDGTVPPAARNFFWLMACAAREGKSDYIMLSDQDDVWSNNKVKRLLTRMKRLEEELGTAHPVLVHSDMEVTDENLDQIAPSFFAYQHCDPERTSFAEVLVENPVTGGALMMNRALLELVTGVREPAEDIKRIWKRLLPASCCMHDWWIALTASCFGTIDCVQEPLSKYRQHGKNTLGAKATGSLDDIKERLGRRQQVKENYRRMLEQAVAFGRRYGRRMSGPQKDTLRAYLSLTKQSPSERFRNIREHHLYKSTLPQILGMCVTMPRTRRTDGKQNAAGPSEKCRRKKRA